MLPKKNILEPSSIEKQFSLIEYLLIYVHILCQILFTDQASHFHLQKTNQQQLMMEKNKNLNWVVEQLKKSKKTKPFFTSSQQQYYVQADLKQIIDVLESYKHIITKTNFNPDDSQVFSHNCPFELHQFVLLHDKLNAAVKKYWKETQKETDNEISFWLQLYSYIQSLQAQSKKAQSIKACLKALKNGDVQKAEEQMLIFQKNQDTYDLFLEVSQDYRSLAIFRKNKEKIKKQQSFQDQGKKKLDDLQKNIIQRQEEINKSEKKISERDKKISESENKIIYRENSQEKWKIEVNEQFDKQKQAIEKTKLSLNEREQEIKKGEKFLKQKTEAQQQREVDLNKREQKIKFEESLLKSEKLGSLFNGSIFAGCSEEQQGAKEFLVEKLRSMNDCPVKRTELLYSFPKFKECQFHPLVDGHGDYVVLVELENGMKVAGYSKEPLQKGRENRGPGFLASLSNKEVFLLKNTEKAKLTVYNDFFLKFGNSELLIKLCEPRMGPPREEELKVKSNFGGYSANDFHSGEFKSQEVLLGANAREAKMRGFEVFKLFL